MKFNLSLGIVGSLVVGISGNLSSGISGKKLSGIVGLGEPVTSVKSSKPNAGGV